MVKQFSRISFDKHIQKLSEQKKRREFWNVLALVLAVFVGIFTVYSLRNDAITLERIATCGCEEHLHTAECMENHCSVQQDPAVLKEQGMETVHAHDEYCSRNGEFLCLLPEVSPHIHTEKCFQDTLVCGFPGDVSPSVHTHHVSCVETLPVCLYHTHSASCFREDGIASCGKIQQMQHQHTELCFEPACSMQEHIHTDACYQLVPVKNISADNTESEATGSEETDTIYAFVSDATDSEATDSEATDSEAVHSSTPSVSDIAITEATTAEATPAEVDSEIMESSSSAKLEISGSDYTVRLFADSLDSGASLHVAEVDPDGYLEQIARRLDVKTSEISFLRLFDLTILDNSGNVLEPSETVRVQIEMDTPDHIQVLHFIGENNPSIPPRNTMLMKSNAAPASLQNTQQNLREAARGSDHAASGSIVLMNASVNNGVIDFSTDSFSVYGIVGLTIEKNILASDGHNYKVSVTYEETAGIPEGADLEVAEIFDVSDQFAEYMSGAEKVIGKNEKVAYARFFDIRIMKDGAAIQPRTPVQVKIELLDELSEDVRAIHFGSQVETLSASLADSEHLTEALVFEASSFSVYGVVLTETIREEFLTSTGDLYEVTMHYNDDAQIPAGSKLKLAELEQGTEEYAAAYQAAYGNDAAETVPMLALDISILSPSGEEIEPRSAVTVDLMLKKLPDGWPAAGLQDNIAVNHLVESADGTVAEKMSIHPRIPEADAGNALSVSFQVNRFSVFTISYTSWFSSSEIQAEVVDGSGKSIGSDTGKNIDNVTWYNVAQLAPEVPGYQFVRATIGSPSGTEFEQIRYSRGWQYRRNNTSHDIGSQKVYYVYEPTDPHVTVSFRQNGGSGSAPESISALPGDSVTLPDYAGTRTGYTFIGWSTGTNLVSSTYFPVYPAGSSYAIPEEDTVLYAVWTSNNPAQANFYIRLDGTIPYEPGSYASSAYTGAITITGSIRNQVWITDNDATKPNNGVNIENIVTANLNQVPTADQLVANINSNSNNLGFKVENRNGEVVVSSITNAGTNSKNYNVSPGDALYVLWYVQKYQGNWHVDGALLVKNKVNIAYHANVTDSSVSNMPMGYQETQNTVVTVGATGSKNGQVRIPVRPGYRFLGWNTKPDGSGTGYHSNDSYTLSMDTTFYAQWSKGTNMMTVSKTNEDGQTLAGAQFRLEEKTASGDFLEKANRTTGANGTFTYDQMENDTLYRMTETYAPNGYEIQNSFYFKVAVDSAALQLQICDENGTFITAPDWLQIEYIPADDPSAQGVARIQFHIRDERIKRSITFKKVDEYGNPLSGASYTLTGSDNQVIGGVLKNASDHHGVFSMNDAVLPYGSYTLTENIAPVGYRIAEPVIFTLNDYVDSSNNGLAIRSGSAAVSCDVSSVTEQGLTTTTYAYTVTVTDTEQPHILVTKQVAVDGNLNPNDLNTSIYYALTKKGEEGYVKKENGDLWIERMDIVNGVPTPARIVFDGVGFGEYDVWEMALINGEYTRMYNGLAVSNAFQLDSVSASSPDGGNNAVVSADDLEAQVDFTNHYGPITASTDFVANKRWTLRDGTAVDPPAGAVIRFTLFSEKKDSEGQIIPGSIREVRSIELDGIHDPDGEDTPWKAVFRYLPLYYEGTLEYLYKVKETMTVEGYYPNEYPNEYLTSSGGTITNRKLTTDIELHKHFDIFPENAALLNSAQGLTFTLSGPDGTTAAYTLDDFTASPENPGDYVKTLTDLPLGEYVLSESGQENLFSGNGYNLVYSVSSAGAESGTGGTEQPVLKLELQNSYAKSGILVVKKNSIIHEAVDEEAIPSEIAEKEFSFIIRRGNLFLQENGSLGTEPYRFSLAENHSRQFTNVPSGRYTVTELDASVEGYIWEVIDGTRNPDGTYFKTIIISDAGDSGEAAFDNRYTRIENGSLTVNKVVDGGPEDAGSRSYKVEITTTRHGEPVWLDAEGNLTTERTELDVARDHPLVFSSVPAGTYTVAENEEAAALEEHSLEVAYSNSMENPDDSNVITIHKDQEAAVTVTNTYTYLFAPVKITKTVTGNMGDKELYFGFDMYVKDTNGDALSIEGVTNPNGLVQFSLRDGEEKLFEKLPKGAVLTIVEHNVHYDTTINGTVGVGDSTTEDALTAAETHSETETDATASYSFSIPDSGATIAFINDYTVEQSVILKKVGFDNTNSRTWDLPGAVFRIYEDAARTKPVILDGKTEFISGDDGVFYTGKLGAGTYYLEETSVPAGYNPPLGMFILRIGEDGVSLGSTAVLGQPSLESWILSEPAESEPESGETDSSDADRIYTAAIRNTVGVVLPSTGGPGTAPVYLFSSLLIILAVTALVVQRTCRRKE